MSNRAPDTNPRAGRPRLTTHDALELVGVELFTEQGFAGTSVEQIAERAGISRRTFFRYFPTKADVVWGDFDAEIVRLRAQLQSVPDDVPTMTALRHAVVDFNRVPPELVERHRARLRLILSEPDLVSVSLRKFAGWREAVAEFVARRVGGASADFVPQLVGELAQAASITSYRQWFAGGDVRLLDLLDAAFLRLESIDPSPAAATTAPADVASRHSGRAGGSRS